MTPWLTILVLLCCSYGVASKTTTPGRSNRNNRNNRNNRLVTVSSITSAPNASSSCLPSHIPATNVIPQGICGINYYTFVNARGRMRRGRNSRRRQSRVLGVSSKPNEVPWQVRLTSTDPRNGNSVTCGGSIIASEWVITAAHCVLDRYTPIMTVHAGGHCLDRESAEAVSTRVVAAFVHRHYNATNYDYDVALLQLRNHLVFNNRIQPICVPQSCEVQCEAGAEGLISGWGTNSSAQSELSPVLRKASVTIVAKDTCQRGLQRNGVNRQLTPRMICAGDPITRSDTCQGDEGGPLACQPDTDPTGRYHLAGVKSFVDKCGAAGFYSVYTRPCAVIHWINDVTREVLNQATSRPAVYWPDPSPPKPSGSMPVPPLKPDIPPPKPHIPPPPPKPSGSPPSIPAPKPPVPPLKPSGSSLKPPVPSPTLPGSSPKPEKNPAVETWWKNDENCGSTKYRNGIKTRRRNGVRIVGGVSARQNEFPWQALIMFSDLGFVWQCGGSLIADRWIMTAAHCFADVSKDVSLDITLGTHSQRTKDQQPSISVVARTFIAHSGYDNDTYDNDIALIRLTEPVSFNENIRPICLLESCNDTSPVRTYCVISGWGLLHENTTRIPDILQKAAVPIASPQVCSQQYNSTTTDNMICAGFATGGIDSCQGDSGGPLACERSDGKYYLNGVTSFGEGCARANYFGVYSRPCRYMDWMKKQMKIYRRRSGTRRRKFRERRRKRKNLRRNSGGRAETNN